MTYGEPSLKQGRTCTGRPGRPPHPGVASVPQYSAASTAAVFDGLARALQPCPDLPELHFIRDYWEEPAYLDALAASVAEYWQDHDRPDRLLLSFHGIPNATKTRATPAPASAAPPAKAVADRLGLADDR